MPTIEQAVASNVKRVVPIPPEIFLSLTEIGMITAQPTVNLPVRGSFAPETILATDFRAVEQQSRVGATRSSTMPAAQASVRARTPQTLSGKALIAPTIGAGGAKLNRYNKILAVVKPVAVASGAVATQTFVVPAVQGADRLLGYQWLAAQKTGVMTLAVRVAQSQRLAIDFFNPTGGALTPTGGTLILFLVQ